MAREIPFVCSRDSNIRLQRSCRGYEGNDGKPERMAVFCTYAAGPESRVNLWLKNVGFWLRGVQEFVHPSQGIL